MQSIPWISDSIARWADQNPNFLTSQGGQTFPLAFWPLNHPPHTPTFLKMLEYLTPTPAVPPTSNDVSTYCNKSIRHLPSSNLASDQNRPIPNSHKSRDPNALAAFFSQRIICWNIPPQPSPRPQTTYRLIAISRYVICPHRTTRATKTGRSQSHRTDPHPSHNPLGHTSRTPATLLRSSAFKFQIQVSPLHPRRPHRNHSTRIPPQTPSPLIPLGSPPHPHPNSL